MDLNEAYGIIYQLADENALTEKDCYDEEQTIMRVEQEEAMEIVHSDLSKRFPDFLT